MKKYLNTNMVRWILLILGIGIVIELTLLVNPFSVLFVVVTIFIGLKLRPHFWGTILLVVGTVTAIGIILNLKILKLAIIVLLFTFFYHYYWKTKDDPRKIHVETTLQPEHESMTKKQPFIKNKLFGNKKYGDHVYELEDVNIQTGFGDTIIDLSMTMLPPGETVVMIRGLVGNMQILVPYDVEVSINHSMLLGKISVLEEREEGFNKNFTFQSKEYRTATRKVKIFTSVVIGDLEVRNI